jgi:SAM-dependent methyltransferase
MGFEVEWTRVSYDRVAEAYADRFLDELEGKPIDRALLGLVAEDVARSGGGIVADLGAGPGQIGAYVRERGAKVVSLDLSPAMAMIAHRRLDLPSTVGSLTALPVATGSLAGATAFYTLIHLVDADVARAAAEIARVLRPGGVVLVAVHLGDEIRHLDEWFDAPVDVDFRFFTTAQLVDQLTAAGLAVEAVLERAPQAEESTRRTYVLARR